MEENEIINNNDFFSKFDLEKMEENDTNINNITFFSEKTKFDNHIEEKIQKLDKRMRYVNYKFEDLKYSFKKFSILIIYLATLLTLIESLINSIDLDFNESLVKFINFIPIFLSCVISLLASIIKFNKYEEKIEDITRATEKCIVTMSKLKGIKENIYFCNENTNLNNLKIHYNKNIYQEYLDSNTHIEKQLIDSDYTKYMKKVVNNDIELKELIMIKEKKLNLLKIKYSKPSYDVSCIKIDILNDVKYNTIKSKLNCFKRKL
tara:strand:+ start:290 stop:1078 length:789 start_codon:yes stop_codon:yes gene_type:complete